MERKKFTIQIKFFADEKYKLLPLALYEYMNIYVGITDAWTRLTQRGLRKNKMSIFLLPKTGLYGGIKVQLIAHKNEPTLLAIDQHRAATNEKRVPL